MLQLRLFARLRPVPLAPRLRLFAVLGRYILASPSFFQLFSYIELPAFEIASDAFATLKVNGSRSL
jgi:hypothetical protein